MHTRINKNKKKFRNGFRCATIVVSLCLLVTACRKEITPQERLTNYTGKSYSEVFEAFWSGMNTNYVFWDIETVNWDNMYKTYKPRFEYLDQHKDDPQAGQKAAQYLVDMTKDLADSHLDISFNGLANLVVSGYPIQTSNFSPAGFRHQLRGDSFPIPRSTFDNFIPKYYLTSAMHGADGNGFNINTGIIPRNGKKILYLEYSSFQLEDEYNLNNTTTVPVKPVLDKFFQYSKDPSVDGLILDLRGNPGGSVPDLDFLIGRLITSPGHFSYTRTKNGSGRLDYTPWVKGYVHPQPGGVNFTKPIAVLVDNNSVSMAEMTTMAVKNIFSNVTVVGLKTWGGTGQIPPNDTRYLGGQFTAANFVKVYMAGVELRDKNMVCFENKGITPDIIIPYDANAVNTRHADVQLDKAINAVTGK
jgi:hypothetical protein